MKFIIVFRKGDLIKSIIIHYHPFSSIFVHFRPFSSIFIHFHPFSSIFIHFDFFRFMPTENIPEEAGPCPFKVPWIPMDPIWPFHPLTHPLLRDWLRTLCQPKMDPHLLDVPLYLDILISLFVWFNPKRCGGGPKVPAGQEIVCHFSQGHAMVTKILDFIHKHSN